MENFRLSPAQAKLKLTILGKQAEAKNNYEIYFRLRSFGLPDEVIEILEKMLKVTSKVSGKVISIGKIIVLEIINYVAQHPFQVTGMAVGLCATYAIGVAVHGLFALIPALAKWKFIGGLLAKLASIVANLCQTVFTPLMVATPIVSVVSGEILDKTFPEFSEGLKQVAKDHFGLFSRIINAVKDELDFSDVQQAWA